MISLINLLFFDGHTFILMFPPPFSSDERQCSYNFDVVDASISLLKHEPSPFHRYIKWNSRDCGGFVIVQMRQRAETAFELFWFCPKKKAPSPPSHDSLSMMMKTHSEDRKEPPPHARAARWINEESQFGSWWERSMVRWIPTAARKPTNEPTKATRSIRGPRSLPTVSLMPPSIHRLSYRGPTCSSSYLTLKYLAPKQNQTARVDGVTARHSLGTGQRLP